MARHHQLYDPPIFDRDPETMRQELLLATHDLPMFTHVGYYVSWYAIVEFFITMILWELAGKLAPADFHLLTRGMDAKVKIERIQTLCKREGITLGKNLRARLEHFQKAHVVLRNKMVHSYLYWPQGDALQMCSIGALPAIAGLEIDSAPPDTVAGLTIFERGLWLNQFAQDLTALVKRLDPVGRPPRGGTIEIGHPLSGLPTDGQAHPPQPAPPAKPHKRDRTRP